MPEAFCPYDDQEEIVIKVKRQSNKEALAAICLILHTDGHMSVAGPLDNAKLIGQMFEGAWSVIKQVQAEKKKIDLVNHQIDIATTEALKSLGVRGIKI